MDETVQDNIVTDLTAAIDQGVSTGQLSERDAGIMCSRMGLAGHATTLKGIGEAHLMSKQAIHQIQAKVSKHIMLPDVANRVYRLVVAQLDDGVPPRWDVVTGKDPWLAPLGTNRALTRALTKIISKTLDQHFKLDPLPMFGHVCQATTDKSSRANWSNLKTPVQKFLNTCLPCDEVAFRRALQAIVGDRYWDDWRHFIEDFFGLIMHDGIACTELHMKRACQYRDIRHAWGGGLDSNEIARIGGFRDRDSLYQTITRMRSDYRWFPERKKGPIAQRPFGGMPDWPPLDQAEMEAFRVRRGARTDHPAATPAEEGNLKDGPERISVDGLGLIPMDVLTNTAVFRRLRAHARRFKNELMIIYGERCAISGCSIETLLEAAHIEDHAETGCNELANGILLRVDLHRLFDRGLLAIEPETLVVHLHPSIRSDPDLAGMQGRTMRIDDIEHDSWRPSTDRLRLRWKTFNGLALATDDPIDGRQGSGRGEP